MSKDFKQLFNETNEWIEKPTDIINENKNIEDMSKNADLLLKYWTSAPAKKFLPKMKAIWKQMSPVECKEFSKKYEKIVLYIAIELI